MYIYILTVYSIVHVSVETWQHGAFRTCRCYKWVTTHHHHHPHHHRVASCWLYQNQNLVGEIPIKCLVIFFPWLNLHIFHG